MDRGFDFLNLSSARCSKFALEFKTGSQQSWTVPTCIIVVTIIIVVIIIMVIISTIIATVFFLIIVFITIIIMITILIVATIPICINTYYYVLL